MGLSSDSEDDDNDDALGAATMWHEDAACAMHFEVLDVVVAAATVLGAAHAEYGMAERAEMPILTVEGAHNAPRR